MQRRNSTERIAEVTFGLHRRSRPVPRLLKEASMGVITCTIRARRRTQSLFLGGLTIVFLLLTMVVLAPTAFAQGGCTEITGTVLDPG
jgi:hypothetical protein